MHIQLILIYLSIGLFAGILIARRHLGGHILAVVVALVATFALQVALGWSAGGPLVLFGTGMLLGIFGVSMALALAPLVANRGWLFVILVAAVCSLVSFVAVASGIVEGVRSYSVVNLSDRMMGMVRRGPFSYAGFAYYATPFAVLAFYKLVRGQLQKRSRKSA
jgi:hypothetical protein